MTVLDTGCLEFGEARTTTVTNDFSLFHSFKSLQHRPSLRRQVYSCVLQLVNVWNMSWEAKKQKQKTSVELGISCMCHKNKKKFTAWHKAFNDPTHLSIKLSAGSFLESVAFIINIKNVQSRCSIM